MLIHNVAIHGRYALDCRKGNTSEQTAVVADIILLPTEQSLSFWLLFPFSGDLCLLNLPSRRFLVFGSGTFKAWDVKKVVCFI